jgi:hypothetical protein
VRSLFQPRVMRNAAIAGLLTAIASYPRLILWNEPPGTILFLCMMLFWTAFCLWSFVFAWHEEGVASSVFLRKVDAKWWIGVTLLGVVAAILEYHFLDPHTRELKFVRFPQNFSEWGAMLLFNLAFDQLFLCFAPYAFFIRLFRKRNWAATQVVMLSVFVLVLKLFSEETLVFSPLIVTLFLLRIVGSSIVIFLYIRGGVVLVCWWVFLLQTRHFVNFTP